MIDYSGKKFLFGKPRRNSNPVRIFFGFILLIGLVFVLRGFSTGQIKPLAVTTPTPTRTYGSYAQEGEVHFMSGNLEKAIEAYQQAVRIDPQDPALWAELARIQVYSTSQFTTDAEKKTRLEEAFATIADGLKLSPEDSNLHAVNSFALDWYANSAIAGEDWQDYLVLGEQAAVRAIQFDSTNALALAYYAELLVDQQKWTQAQQYISQALQRDPSLMDVHRVNGFVNESIANYQQAIQEYLRAIEITPNMNFLYISLGANYRKLANLSSMIPEQNMYYDLALEAFDNAATINERLGVKDPIPLRTIANTYVQMGQPLAASVNMLAALNFKPDDPSAYGEVGVVYYKARNYEGSILPLKCAVRGCTALESCTVRNSGLECSEEIAADPSLTITGLPLTNTTAIYYYIYGSVLAGMNTPATNYCAEAYRVFDEISAGFREDDTIMAIVNEGLAICDNARFGATQTVVALTPVSGATATPTITPSP